MSDKIKTYPMDDAYGNFVCNDNKTGWAARDFFDAGWQAALSQSEPAQVSQPYMWAIEGVSSRAWAMKEWAEAEIRNSDLKAVPLFLTPPDHERLKAELNTWKFSYEVLKLRVAELIATEEASENCYKIAIQERDRLQSECDRSNLRVLELETVARDSLSALIYHSGQTRPIERTEDNIKAIRKTLWEN